MIEILTIVAVALVLGVAFVLVRAARQPDMFGYGRSTVVRASPDRIFPLIADLASFNTWNPFNEEPSIKGTYSGPARGPGARYAFESKRAGTGHIEVTEEAPPRKLILRLVMTKPMACDNRVEFSLDPVADGTRVTWSMSGRMNFVGKVLNQVIDCESMTGKHFERGLAKLKSIAEGQPQPAAPEAV